MVGNIYSTVLTQFIVDGAEGSHHTENQMQILLPVVYRDLLYLHDTNLPAIFKMKALLGEILSINSAATSEKRNNNNNNTSISANKGYIYMSESTIEEGDSASISVSIITQD